MNVLVINGSPQRHNSHTYQITKAFLDGFADDTQVREFEVSTLNIKPCAGCFSCWYKTPGKCAIKDDMNKIYDAINWADTVILSFPLYFFGLPSTVKNIVDRCLPYELPYRGTVNNLDNGLLDMRDQKTYDKKLVLISSCEYVYADVVYEALVKQFDLIVGEGNYEKIFVSEGMLLVDEKLQRQIKSYLAFVTKAGTEFYSGGKISKHTEDEISKPIFSQKVFEKLTDTHWTKLINENTK